MKAQRAWRVRAGVAGLALASCGVGLLAAEGLVRWAAPQAVRVAWEDEWNGIRVARPRTQGRHAVPGKFDVRVSISGQRFRARREYALRPPAGVTRVAVLGDSMAFGWGVEDGETYPAQLEAVLSGQGGGGFEVINAGFPGACLGEKAAWYERGVRPLHPALVVLTLLGDDVDGDLFWRVFSLGADGRAVPSARLAGGPGPRAVRSTRAVFKSLPGYETLAERSHLFALVRRAATRAASRERTTPLGQAPATPEAVRRFRQEGLALLAAELRWLRERTAEDGAGLAVVLVPFREGVYAAAGWWPDELRWKSRAIADAAAKACRESDVPFADLTAAMVERARSTARPLYHEGSETHPTREGYRAIAEEVAALLLERSPLLRRGAASEDPRQRPQQAGGGVDRPEGARARAGAGP